MVIQLSDQVMKNQQQVSEHWSRPVHTQMNGPFPARLRPLNPLIGWRHLVSQYFFGGLGKLQKKKKKEKNGTNDGIQSRINSKTKERKKESKTHRKKSAVNGSRLREASKRIISNLNV